MFGKLRKKIFGSIFTVILIFVLSVSIISFCVIVSNLYEAQAERTKDNAYSGVKGCQAYFSAVMGIVENASKNDSLERVLTGGHGMGYHFRSGRYLQLCREGGRSRALRL